MTAMIPMTYPATITQAPEGDVVVRFRDVPEALTGGTTYEEAAGLASDALAVALKGYLEAGLPLPAAGPAQPGEVDVPVDPALAARAMLIAAMTEQRLSNVALAQRLGKDEKAVRRIVSGQSASFALTLAALRCVGIRPALAV